MWRMMRGDSGDYRGEGLTIKSLGAIAFYFLVIVEGERVLFPGTCAADNLYAKNPHLFE